MSTVLPDIPESECTPLVRQLLDIIRLQHERILQLEDEITRLKGLKNFERCASIGRGQRNDKGKIMRATKLQELEEMVAKLLTTELPAGQDRHNALREVGKFRVRITAIQRNDLGHAHTWELKAKK